MRVHIGGLRRVVEALVVENVKFVVTPIDKTAAHVDPAPGHAESFDRVIMKRFPQLR